MKQFFSVKKILLFIAVVLVLGTVLLFVSGDDSLNEEIEIEVVTRGNVREVVSETGFVQPARAVDVAFELGGRVVSIPVEEGDVVEKGEVLVELDPTDREIELASARARLRAEQVRLDELLRGADSISLDVSGSAVDFAKTALENAQTNLHETVAQHDQLVENAQKTLLTTGLVAYLVDEGREGSNYSYAAPVVSGTYTGTEEGIYYIDVYSSGAQSGSSYRVTGLEDGAASVSTVNPTPVGTRGLYIQFPDNFARNTEWEIPIPNTRSSSYTSNLNAYNATLEARDVAIKAAESAVKSAEAALTQSNQQYTQVSSPARDERIEAQRAMVSQMHAALRAAELALEKTAIRAPFTGIVTHLMVEAGEIVSPTVPVVSLIANTNFELEVHISESDIQEITIDDTATVAFDAYDDEQFEAKVIDISPTAEVVDGVRAFSVTLQFLETDEHIRAGLSADIDILAAERTDVIAVPTRSIVEHNGEKSVRTFDGEVLTYVPVVVGLRGSDGFTEIVSGLREGVEIITFAREETIEQIESQ